MTTCFAGACNSRFCSIQSFLLSFFFGFYWFSVLFLTLFKFPHFQCIIHWTGKWKTLYVQKSCPIQCANVTIHVKLCCGLFRILNEIQLNFDSGQYQEIDDQITEYMYTVKCVKCVVFLHKNLIFSLYGNVFQKKTIKCVGRNWVQNKKIHSGHLVVSSEHVTEFADSDRSRLHATRFVSLLSLHIRWKYEFCERATTIYVVAK